MTSRKMTPVEIFDDMISTFSNTGMSENTVIAEFISDIRDSELHQQAPLQPLSVDLLSASLNELSVVAEVARLRLAKLRELT